MPATAGHEAPESAVLALAKHLDQSKKEAKAKQTPRAASVEELASEILQRRRQWKNGSDMAEQRLQAGVLCFVIFEGMIVLHLLNWVWIRPSAWSWVVGLSVPVVCLMGMVAVRRWAKRQAGRIANMECWKCGFACTKGMPEIEAILPTCPIGPVVCTECGQAWPCVPPALSPLLPEE